MKRHSAKHGQSSRRYLRVFAQFCILLRNLPITH